MNFVNALNALQNRPYAVVILLIGFGMLISCKKWGIDTTIAGGVIGVAANMLMNKHEPEPSDPKA